MTGRVLIIGELIANEGLGLQGDIITITALGGTAVTATTQVATSNNPGDRKVQQIEPEFITQQIEACLENADVNCIKIGALHSGTTINTICDALEKQQISIPVVVSPILAPDQGNCLLDPQGIETFKKRLPDTATLLVLNVRDAEILSDIEITDVDSMRKSVHFLNSIGFKGVMITGGILRGDKQHDILLTETGEEILSSAKSPLQIRENYRFTGGWALATAIATSIAQEFSFKEAINRARQFIDQAIASSFNADEEYQNLNLAHTIQPFNHDNTFQPYTVIEGGKLNAHER